MSLKCSSKLIMDESCVLNKNTRPKRKASLSSESAQTRKTNASEQSRKRKRPNENKNLHKSSFKDWTGVKIPKLCGNKSDSDRRKQLEIKRKEMAEQSKMILARFNQGMLNVGKYTTLQKEISESRLKRFRELESTIIDPSFIAAAEKSFKIMTEIEKSTLDIKYKYLSLNPR